MQELKKLQPEAVCRNCSRIINHSTHMTKPLSSFQSKDPIPAPRLKRSLYVDMVHITAFGLPLTHNDHWFSFVQGRSLNHLKCHAMKCFLFLRLQEGQTHQPLHPGQQDSLWILPVVRQRSFSNHPQLLPGPARHRRERVFILAELDGDGVRRFELAFGYINYRHRLGGSQVNTKSCRMRHYCLRREWRLCEEMQ